jgi:penicillin V acylase-like amidase (Ntn superfamily)
MRVQLFLALLLLLVVTAYVSAETSCSTFQLAGAGIVLVGHNLDDSIETPGMIVVNQRGLAKRGARYKDLFPFAPGSKSDPRLSWVSRYGSITYNVFGREFPDGGMNEAGLYVGEMTLRGTRYPTESGLTRLYHGAWIQYLLDSFATVPEVVDALGKVVPEGHCQWHFFVSDREGRAAAIEFLDGKTVVRTGDALPWKLLTNSTYDAGLSLLAEFEGFGGSRKLEPTPDCRPDLRFVTAAGMIRDIQADPAGSTVAQAFSVLQAMWCGVNRFSLVFDPLTMRMYFTTYKARSLRWVDFASFNFACGPVQPCLDIHRDIAGDAAGAFVPFTDEANRALLKSFFKGVDAGFWGNLVWKPTMAKNLQAWQQATRCTE